MHMILYTISLTSFPGDKIRDTLLHLRTFRTYIALWNILMMICMLL